MKIKITVAFAAAFVFPTVAAFSTHLLQPASCIVRSTSTALKEGYVPDGMTPGEWLDQQIKDKHKKKEHFKSRSLQSFQDDLEKGKIRHLFPTVFAKEQIKRHMIESSDVPYMQREGGSYDNSDVNVGYIPDGMTPHQWHDIQRNEKKAKESKEFAKYGPKGFKSRSLQSFQEDLQKGKVSHLFPVMFAKERVKKGLIKEEDVPYMQRGGSWDNADVRGAH